MKTITIKIEVSKLKQYKSKSGKAKLLESLDRAAHILMAVKGLEVDGVHVSIKDIK